MPGPLKLSSPPTREFWEIPVLFEDADLLAVDKPAGLLTAPDPATPERPSLMGLAHAGITAGKPWAAERGLSYLMNVHRPDVETSGVLLLAKNKPILVSLGNLFGSERVARHCITLVRGAPEEEVFEVDAKLAPHPTQPDLMKVDPRNGKKSRTVFRVLERFNGWTLLQAEPATDRPHQVRVHLRHARLPVAGDELYGGRPLLLSSLKDQYHLKPNQTERPLLGCAAIHVAEMSFPHPVGGQPVIITAPWPKELTVAIKYLRRYAAP